MGVFRKVLCFRMNSVGSYLSKDEPFVIESLSTSYEGSWRPGEDPPDAYLMQENVEVAI